MSLGGQELLNAVAPSSDGVMPVQAYSSGGKGGALTPEQAQALQYYVASQPAVIDHFNNAGLIIDPTALAQQAILARPPRQYAYQPLLSRYVTSDGTGGTGAGTGAINAPRPSYTGLMYPSVQRPSLSVPSYTSRYDTGSGGGGGGGDASVGGGYAAVPDYSIPVSELGTYSGYTMTDPSFVTGIGIPGESAAQDAIDANNVAAGLAAAADAEAAATEAGMGGFSGDVGGFGASGDYGGFSGDFGGFSGDVGGFGSDAASGAGAGVGGDGSNSDSGGSDSGGGGSDSGGGDSGGGSDGGSDGGGGGWAKGGKVTKKRLKGRNPTGPDDGYGALEEGEYVIRKKAVQKYGDGLMSMINSGKFKG